VTDEQEKQRISQLLASDKRFNKQSDNFYYQALNAIKDNLRAFYARYATSRGLTVDVIRQRVSHWDLDQFIHVIDVLSDGAPLSKDLKKHIHVYKYQAAGGSHGDVLTAIVGVGLAVATDKVKRLGDRRIGQSYVSEKEYQQIIASKHEEWRLPREQGVQLTPAVRHVIDAENWSNRLWNHSDNMTADVQSAVRDALSGGMDSARLAKLLTHLTPDQKARGNLESAAKSRMWMVDRLVRTESARAVDVATMSALSNRRVGLIDIVTEPDACDKCKELANEGPFPLEKCPALPRHDNCRCHKREHVDA